MFSIFFIGNNVYGYDLKYKAFVSDQYTYFLTMGNAFKDPNVTSNFISTTDLVDLTKQSVYQSYKFMIQSDAMTKYNANNRV